MMNNEYSNWQKASIERPIEQMTLDGFKTGKSIHCLSDQHEVVMYDFKRSCWINLAEKKVNVKSFIEVPYAVTFSQPEDGDEVKCLTLRGQYFTGTYIASENLVVDENEDFLFLNEISRWELK